MKQKILQDIVNLTEECLRRYWQLDYNYVLDFCKEDVVWVGSTQEQFIQGYDLVKQDFEHSMLELKPCHIKNLEFFVAQNQVNCCTIVGRYLTTTDESVEYFLQVQQRCTFSWELVEGQPKIAHIHVSNPMGELKLAENECFVNKMGKMAQNYFNHYLESVLKENKIVVEDIKNVTHILLLSDIIYVSAYDKCVDLYMPNKKITAKISVSQFEKMAGEDFLSVHRSFVVNINHI